MNKWTTQGLKAEVDSSYQNLILLGTHGHPYLLVPPYWQAEAVSLKVDDLSRTHKPDTSLVGESRLYHFHSCRWTVYQNHLSIVCSIHISAPSTPTNKKQQNLLLPSRSYPRGGTWGWLADRSKQWICPQLTRAYRYSSFHIAGRQTAEPTEEKGGSNMIYLRITNSFYHIINRNNPGTETKFWK